MFLSEVLRHEVKLEVSRLFYLFKKHYQLLKVNDHITKQRQHLMLGEKEESSDNTL